MVKKILYNYIYILLASMMVVVSCMDDGNSPLEGDIPMSFTCDVIQPTRATYGEYTGKDFGVEATYYSDDYKSNRGIESLSNVKVTYDGTTCSTTDTYYWIPIGNMHFAAYSPYFEDLSTAPVQVTLPGKPYEGYSFSGTIDGETNLMFANEQYGALNTHFPNGVVPIEFNHTLTQVKFRARMSDTSVGSTMNIKSLKLKNIRNRGSITFKHNGKSDYTTVDPAADANKWNSEYMVWTAGKTFPLGSEFDTQHLADYEVSTSGMTSISNEFKEFNTTLYLMPQQLYSAGESEFLQQVEIIYTIITGGIEGEPIKATLPLKNVGDITQWTVNKSVLYTLIVEAGKPLTLTVSVQPWTLEEFTNEFSNTVTVNTEHGNDGRIKWTAGTYENIVGDKVVLKDDIDIAAELKFTISGPLGNTWQAILVTNSGDPGAFILSQTEGAIGEECTLTIKAKQQNTSNVSNQAELLFVVRTSSGILPVDILTTLGKGNNYTIIQNINK